MTQNDWIDILFSTQAPPKVPRPSGIIFDDIPFTEPTSFGHFPPPFGAGLYVILVPDITARPRTYRAIYFGQAGDLAKRVRKSHEKYGDWVTEAEGAHRLYVSFYGMSSSETERVATERRLVQKYHPACNEIFNSFRALLGLP